MNWSDLFLLLLFISVLNYSYTYFTDKINTYYQYIRNEIEKLKEDVLNYKTKLEILEKFTKMHSDDISKLNIDFSKTRKADKKSLRRINNKIEKTSTPFTSSPTLSITSSTSSPTPTPSLI